MKRVLAVAAGLGLLAVAYGVSYTTPGQPVLEAPFGTPAVIGEETTSRHLVVTFREVVLADEIEIASWEGTTSGVWLAGELTVEATTEPTTMRLDVFIDGVRYSGSGRIDDETVIGGLAEAGLPITGPFAVELPADVLDLPGARAAVIRVAGGGDSRLDSVVELTVDLTTLEHLDRAEYDGIRDGDR